MRRVILIATLVPFVLALGIGQAEAKGCPPPDVGDCPAEPVALRAVITGPGLDEPIVIEGPARWHSYSFQLGEMLRDPWPYGGGELGREAPAPDLRTLGPRYRIVYWFDDYRASQESFQDLYPYAPGGPMAYTGAGWPLTGPGSWWRAPAALRTSLIAYGLPASPPIDDSLSLPAAVPPGPSPLWVILVAAAGLAGLVVFGAIAGRPRRAVA